MSEPHPSDTKGSGVSRLRRLRGYWLRDHGWLRVLLPNIHWVDAALVRSGHPSAAALRRAKAAGVRSVLSLRGGADNTPNLIERETTLALDLPLRFIELRSSKLPKPEALLALVTALREMPKPLLVHCKSGADRTGLAVTLYHHVLFGMPLTQARRALHWRYFHFTWSKAGRVHRLLDAYAKAHRETGISFETWVRDDYDPSALER